MNKNKNVSRKAGQEEGFTQRRKAAKPAGWGLRQKNGRHKNPAGRGFKLKKSFLRAFAPLREKTRTPFVVNPRRIAS